MAATKGHVAGPADGAGKKINNSTFDRGGQTIHNQAVIAGDADEDDHLLRVVAAGILQAVPHLTMTDLVTGTCKVDEVALFNTTGGILTVTVQDKSGTPVKLLNGYPLAPGQPFVLPMKRARFNAGVSWQASAAGITGYVIAHQ